MRPETKTRLLASMNAGRLLIMCGAGLSMAAPSNLPSARTVAECCFDKYRLESDPDLDVALRQDLEALAEHFAGQNTLSSVFIEHLVPWPDFVRQSNAGHAAEARTLIPMIAAAKRSVEGTICFSKPSGPVSPGDARDLQKAASAANVRLLQIKHRELHGKFLLWDGDHAVITSLNWSSSDTRADAPHAEIGLYINSPGLAQDIRARLEKGWPALATH